MKVFLRLLEQNIPVNAIHTDFYDDKKYAFEDIDIALENVKRNLKELLLEMSPEDRQAGFQDLMTMKPFSEYELTIEALADLPEESFSDDKSNVIPMIIAVLFG